MLKEGFSENEIFYKMAAVALLFTPNLENCLRHRQDEGLLTAKYVYRIGRVTFDAGQLFLVTFC